MSRIGQILIREGIVTENSVARTLGIQHFAGGRLGTLLLERGAVDEDELGRGLALQHGCDYVPWELLGNVAPMVIALLPAKFAVRHAAIPYERREGSLRVAMRDPTDLRILDELYFVTGRKIVPAVAPEVRIYHALEKYYGERRTPRFAILAEKLTRPGVRRAGSRAPAAPAQSLSLDRISGGPIAPPPDFAREPPSGRVEPLATEVWGEMGEPELPEPPIIQSWKIPDAPFTPWAPAPPSEPESPPAEKETIAWELPAEDEAPVPADSAGGAPSSDVVFAGEPSLREPALAPGSTSPSASARGRGRTFDFPEVLAARGRSVIGKAALDAMARRFRRAALFAARRGGVSGWEAAGDGINESLLRRIEIPWNEPSIFLNVRLSRAFYLGPLPPLSRHRSITRAMGGAAKECLVQPVLMKEKLVAFLYAEFGEGRGATPMDLAFVRELAGATALALAESIRSRKKEAL